MIYHSIIMRIQMAQYWSQVGCIVISRDGIEIQTYTHRDTPTRELYREYRQDSVLRTVIFIAPKTCMLTYPLL